uniref:Nodule-specific Glycine Rich Peptide n=1 Tax=Medicago truncatula TaxID=3880 RepID=I3T3E3_MEDTR|nr:unknown [Medicago truncatula]
MKTKHLIFELFICTLMLISVVEIEQSKNGKQFGATKDVISKVETVPWKPWGGGWINYGEKGGAGRKNGEQGSGGNRGGKSSQGGGEQKGVSENGGNEEP